MYVCVCMCVCVHVCVGVRVCVCMYVLNLIKDNIYIFTNPLRFNYMRMQSTEYFLFSVYLFGIKFSLNLDIFNNIFNKSRYFLILIDILNN